MATPIRKLTQNRRELKKELRNLGEYIHWYLSDWMDEQSIISPKEKLLNPELLSTWEKLKTAAKNQEAFEDFFCMAMDSCYRYAQIAEDTSDVIVDVNRSMERLIRALNRNSSIRDWAINSRLNDYTLAEVEKQYTVKIKKISVDDNRVINQFFLNLVDILRHLRQEMDKWQEAQRDDRRSKKRGRTGLAAFYTNSLCDITKNDFKRPCYAEIASIANAVLEVDANNVITEENVRMNFNNYSKRLSKAKSRKISEK